MNRISMGQTIGNGKVTVNDQEYLWSATKQCGCKSCGKQINIFKGPELIRTLRVPITTIVNDELVIQQIKLMDEDKK